MDQGTLYATVGDHGLPGSRSAPTRMPSASSSAIASVAAIWSRMFSMIGWEGETVSAIASRLGMSNLERSAGIGTERLSASDLTNTSEECTSPSATAVSTTRLASTMSIREGRTASSRSSLRPGGLDMDIRLSQPCDISGSAVLSRSQQPRS
jgi:hypothetical protein